MSKKPENTSQLKCSRGVKWQRIWLKFGLHTLFIPGMSFIITDRQRVIHSPNTAHYLGHQAEDEIVKSSHKTIF